MKKINFFLLCLAMTVVMTSNLSAQKKTEDIKGRACYQYRCLLDSCNIIGNKDLESAAKDLSTIDADFLNSFKIGRKVRTRWQYYFNSKKEFDEFCTKEMVLYVRYNRLISKAADELCIAASLSVLKDKKSVNLFNAKYISCLNNMIEAAKAHRAYAVYLSKIVLLEKSEPYKEEIKSGTA
jgi:hypothetical protein